MAAGRLFRSLNGVFCLYKPPDVSLRYVKEAFSNKIVKELNELHQPETRNYLEVSKEESGITVNVRPSYATSALALGPRYLPGDLFPRASSALGFKSSGVCGVKTGREIVRQFDDCSLTKTLQIKGRLGEAMQYMYKEQKVVAKASYSRVTRSSMNKVLSSFEAAHQKKIFGDLGIHIQSQEAYDLACAGLIRPGSKDIVAVYSLKLIEFEPPDFTIEMICINVKDDYCLQLVHDLGLQLRTLAHCTGLRCIRNGPFTIHHALLLKNLTVEALIENMEMCKSILIEKNVQALPHIKFPSRAEKTAAKE